MREYQVNRYFRSHNIKARMKKKPQPQIKVKTRSKKKIGEQFRQVIVIHISRDLQQQHA
jgi:hypothetical protein